MGTVSTQVSFGQTVPPGLAWLKGLGNAIVDLFFPSRCVACHRLGDWLCSDCQSEIELIHPPVCRFCAMPLQESARSDMPLAAGCVRCRTEAHILDGLAACAFHSGPLRQAIHEFKYNGLYGLAEPLGRLMADGWQRLRPADQEIDVIVPVPLHRRRELERGYNQAALLARELGNHLHIPIVEDVLVRKKATARQTDLKADERKANVRDAFQCSAVDLSGKAVLLVDDVCTTGSTLEAACSALRAAGTSVVWAYTLARAR